MIKMKSINLLFKPKGKIKLLLIFCFFTVVRAHANDTIQYTSKPISFGIGQAKISFLSPIVYHSYLFSVGYNKTITSSNCEKYIFYNMGFGVHTNNNKHKMFSMGEDLYLGQNHLIKTNSSNAFRLYMGYAYWYDDDFYIKPENINNFLYTNISNKVSSSFVLTFKHKNIYIKNHLSIPVLGLYYGSKFSQDIPGIIEKEASVWEACKFGSFGINKHISNDLICDVRVKYKQTKFQTIRLEYAIEYAKMTLHNNTKNTVFHEFKISTLINQVNYNHEF